MGPSLLGQPTFERSKLPGEGLDLQEGLSLGAARLLLPGGQPHHLRLQARKLQLAPLSLCGQPPALRLLALQLALGPLQRPRELLARGFALRQACVQRVPLRCQLLKAGGELLLLGLQRVALLLEQLALKRLGANHLGDPGKVDLGRLQLLCELLGARLRLRLRSGRSLRAAQLGVQPPALLVSVPQLLLQLLNTRLRPREPNGVRSLSALSAPRGGSPRGRLHDRDVRLVAGDARIRTVQKARGRLPGPLQGAGKQRDLGAAQQRLIERQAQLLLGMPARAERLSELAGDSV